MGEQFTYICTSYAQHHLPTILLVVVGDSHCVSRTTLVTFGSSIIHTPSEYRVVVMGTCKTAVIVVTPAHSLHVQAVQA